MQSHQQQRSLSEVNGSVDTTHPKLKGFRRLAAFFGPAYLVSVGYMDPGNWATDIAGGSAYGYSLLWVLLLSNLMAVLLQSLSARLGIVSRLDLAQASRQTYSKPVNLFLYGLAEIAIAATDLAEILGMAIGLQLLFGFPLLWGVAITILDTFLLLVLINFGMRQIEAFIICLISIIGVAFLIELLIAKPQFTPMLSGFIPGFKDDNALYIAIAIIGATVMPHNLYLHSSLVQTRKFDRTEKAIRRALKFNFFDSIIALNLAFLVNAAILILAASTFFLAGEFHVEDIRTAHHFLEPLLGTSIAPILFAIALIAAGQSSTITGTLAGQIVMEGYLNLRIAPWMRRLITRLIAILPAFFTIYYFGEDSAGRLLVFSQVILSLQLGFAVIPLIHFVSDSERMGQFVISKKVKIIAWLSAIIIIFLNGRLIARQLMDWAADPAMTKILYFIVIPFTILVAAVLIYITIKPFVHPKKHDHKAMHHEAASPIEMKEVLNYNRIAVALDFSSRDQQTLSAALMQGGKNADYLLIHVLESAGAMMMSGEINDREHQSDQRILDTYCQDLIAKGYRCQFQVGFGRPSKSITSLSEHFNADLIVMGGHGHRGYKDFVFGSTVESVRHKVKIPVLIVR